MPSPVSEVYPFGLLVKSWATGLDHFSKSFPPNPPPSQPPTTPIAADATWALPPLNPLFVPISGSANPASIHAVAMSWNDFETILHNANNFVNLGTISNPTNATNVVVVQGDNATMVLRLPPALKLQQAEKAILADAPYDLPVFYNGLYKDPNNLGDPATQVLPTTSTDILQLHANRIGDYTMSLCN